MLPFPEIVLAWRKNINRLTTINIFGWMFGLSALILWACSSLRHLLFQSNAYDLGIFDQAVYLISQGQTPISTIRQLHILGDHAAFILYPLGLLYKIYASVYWLFVIQAVALTAAIFPLVRLSRQAGLPNSQVMAVAVAYLLYPLVFNVNLFDFHSEVLAIPIFLWAVWFARTNQILWFCISSIFILSCKEVLALTVAAMGLWLLLFEKKRFCGAFALVTGVAWFLIATQKIVPFFSGDTPFGLSFYSYLGDSITEIAKNLILRPDLVLSKIFSLETGIYLALVCLPVIWGLSPLHLAPLIGGLPTLGLNILSTHAPQRNLVHHYSLPLLPFLFLAIIASLAAGKVLIKSQRGIILWSLIGFLALAKYGYFWSMYLEYVDNWQATRAAISQVQTLESVYTTSPISTHLTHRKLIKFTQADAPPQDLNQFNYILLNVRHPGWKSNENFANSLVQQLQVNPEFTVKFQQDGVYLFHK